MKEAQNIEWKEAWRDEFLRWICGFANAEGGRLHIGRNDRGVVVGVPNAARLLVEIPNKVRDILGIVVEVNLHEENGKEWLEIVVEPYPHPVSYKGEYHLRSGSTKQELKGAALNRFLLRKHGLTWDGVPVPYVSVDALDGPSLTRFRHLALRSGRLSEEVLAEPAAVLLERLRLLAGDYVKRAAVLLFHPDPEAYVGGAWVKIGYFETHADLRYQDEVHGSLLDQVEQIVTILKAKYLKALISYEGLQRIETLQVPEPALREAVLNAVIHKDYACAVPIQISVYADRLMIWNPGQLPLDWTLEKLLDKHASIPFNPDVANGFFRCGQIEAWGRGIERIVKACREAGAPLPLFKDEHTGLWVEFPFFSLPVTRPESQPESQPESLEVRVLRLVAGATMSKAELARALKQKKISGQLNKTIRQLLAEQRLAYTIPEKPNSRLQKYQLTAKGKAVLAEVNKL